MKALLLGGGDSVFVLSCLVEIASVGKAPIWMATRDLRSVEGESNYLPFCDECSKERFAMIVTSEVRL